MRAVAILLAAVVCSGCTTAATSSRVAETLELTLPECRLERDSTMVLGRASLALLRGLSGIAADGVDDDAREILRSVRRIEVSAYRSARACEVVSAPPEVSRQLAADGWHAMIAAVEDGGDLSWVFTREGPDGGTSGMLVIALDQEELEVVRLDGDIDRVLIAALADDPSSTGETARSGVTAGATSSPPARTK